MIASVRTAEGAAIFGENIEVLVGDLNTLASLPEGIDAIVHAAATSPAPGAGLASFESDNADATRALVECARVAGVPRIIYLSSISVHGEIAVPIVDEDTPVNVPDPYGAAKLAGERVVAELTESGGTATLVLRLPGVIGRGAARNWLAGVHAALAADEEVEIYNPDDPFNNACHVSDLTELVILALERDWRGAQCLTVASRGQVTIRQAVEILAEAMEVVPRIRVIDAPQPSFLVSNERAVREFGFTPLHIRDALVRFGREQSGLTPMKEMAS